MKLVVSGGGTGGHVYPALTVIETLLSTPAGARSQLRSDDVLWVGCRGGLEEGIVEHAGVAFVGLPAGGLAGMGAWQKGRNALRIAGSVLPARQILTQFAPDVVFVTGGYACVSVTLAARTLRKPVVIYLPDIVPGQAIRQLSRFAARVAVTSEESIRYFEGSKVEVTGYPVRAGVFSMDRSEARRELGLDPQKATLLVFGGSRGAQSINRALVAGLDALLPSCQIIHVSGHYDSDWVVQVTQDLPEEIAAEYHHFDYMHNMPAALVAADLAVARAGAATMGEFPAAGLPSLLVPYPHSGQHQQPNADHMARHGAAQVLPDAGLDETLVSTIGELLHDADALESMQNAARAMARPDAAEALANQLWSLAGRAADSRAGEVT
ncbi:glycosyltransferase [Chloroflexota bacterium]